MKPSSGALAVLAVFLPSLSPASPFSLSPAPVAAEMVVEPRSGTTFEAKRGSLTLIGIGLRTRTMLKVKVYAIGLYVADSMLPTLRAKVGSPDLYNELVWGDFPKELHLRLVRDVTAEQMRNNIREALDAQGADKTRTEALISGFGPLRAGQDYRLRWLPGGALETISVGQPNPPIPDKAFSAAGFSIWLGAHPIQSDIKKDLVSRLK